MKSIQNKESDYIQLKNELDHMSRKLEETEVAYKVLKATCHEKVHTIKGLESRNNKLEVEAELAEKSMQDLIRKQQEESFNRIDSGTWLPREEAQVKSHLEELKRLMKNATKEAAIKTIPVLTDISQKKLFFDSLRKFIRWETDEDFLHGMNKEKQPAVILNSLLAHSVCQKVLCSAFFFHDGFGDGYNELAAVYKDLKKGGNIHSAVS